MSEALVVSALVAATLIGVGAAAFLVMRSPAFWAEAAKQLFSALIPVIIKYLGKRMSPEEEADYQRAVRAGRGDDWLRRRRGQPPKG